MQGIRLYCGLSEKQWNGRPVSPGGYACVSPISGKSIRTKRETCVYVPEGTEVIQDSGAFSDSWNQRLDFAAALERQQQHASKYQYESFVTHRASYDLLIDEVWTDGNRTKRRWSAASAAAAIDETIAAAAWINAHRNGKKLILSAQGVDAPQYLDCVARLLPYFCPGDVLGLGGWCVIGKMPKRMMGVFIEAVNLVIPFIAKEGLTSVHLWGVIYPPALAILLHKCLEYGIAVSTDSVGVSVNPAYGQWGYGSWRNNHYERPPLAALGEDRARHAALTRAWLECFSLSPDYAAALVKLGVSHIAASEGAPRCLICKGDMRGKRPHAQTCGATCRKALSRKEPERE